MFITNIATKGVKMFITMSEERDDVKDQVEDSSTETEEEVQEETSEETSEQEESKAVPYSRFKEVNDELKRLKEEREAKEETKVETKANNADAPLTRKEWEAEMRERDLKSLNLPEKVAEEVKSYAEYKRISVQEAAQAPHIQSLKEEVEQEERLHKGAASSTSKGKSVKNVDPENPPNFDLSTKEGQEGWEEWKKAVNEKLQN